MNEGDIYKINNNTIGVKSSIGVTPEDFTQSFFNIKAEVVTFGNYNDYVLIDKKMYLNVERANFNDFTITSNDPILDETNEIDLTSPSTDKKKTYDFETKDFVQVSGATYV
ncbi:hypothetical protein FACS189459_3300 [Bacilli bacterium]|nr:hypothetical protein FACS189459_3300 [Bacilli bacterium]